MSIQVCLVLLALFSLTAASEPNCEELVRPLEDLNKIYGKWIYYAGASDSEAQTEIIKYATNSWLEVLPVTGSNFFTFHSGDLIDGKCYYGSGNSSTRGDLIKLSFHKRSVYYESFGKYLETCPDCYTWLTEVTQLNEESKKAQMIFFYAKTEQVNPSHLEIFKKQLKCLNISGEIYFPETTNLCPDEQEGAGEGINEEP